jgi:septal ring factor EnvC (AmiA/AmiB activator)
MDQVSEAILALKPVTFHYKNGDTKKAEAIPQYGLIAEDVAAVNPDLTVPDKDGQVYSVRYDAINVMLLNEFLKEHKKVEEQQASIAELKSTVAQQQKGMEALVATVKEQAAQIQKVSAQVGMSKPAPKVVINNP